MKAIILAAGVGNRLGDSSENKPKSMLEFNGLSLMKRHIQCLKQYDVSHLTIVVGYQADLIKEHLSDSEINVNFITNTRFTEGSHISLGCAREILINEPEYLVMDADVLYHSDMIKRLIESDNANCLLLDRDFLPGDEPVKICVNEDNRIIEFRKQLPDDIQFSIQGESVGFFKFNREIGNRLVKGIDERLSNDENDTPYEEIIRDLLLADPDQFSYEDVTGVPWIEIDFPEDIQRAQNEILPKL